MKSGLRTVDVIERSLELNPVSVFPVVVEGEAGRPRETEYEGLAEGTAGAVKLYEADSNPGPELLEAVVEARQAPFVALTSGRYLAEVGEPVVFTAEALVLDGVIDRFEWDFDGDGVSEETTSTGRVSHVYTNDVDRFVGVKVVTDDGRVANASARVVISAEPGAFEPPAAPSAATALQQEDSPESYLVEWLDNAVDEPEKWFEVSDGEGIVRARTTDTSVVVSDLPANVHELELVAVNEFGRSDPVRVTLQGLALVTTAGATVADASDEDVVSYDPSRDSYWMFLDLSDVGVTEELDALVSLDDGSFLMSFDRAIRLPGVGRVENSDVVRFVPTDLGETTAGSFEWFVDGSDVLLSRNAEDIDSLAVTPDGDLVASFRGNFRAGRVRGVPQDLLVLRDASYGSRSVGDWSLYLDGSDISLTSRTEKIRGASIPASGSPISLSTLGSVRVPGVNAGGGDIIACEVGALEPGRSSCAFSLQYDSLDEIDDINAIHVGPPVAIGG